MSRVPSSDSTQRGADAVPPVLRRRTRMRRTAALGGLLAAVGGLVTLRAAATPAPTTALGATGLAHSVSSGASAASKAHTGTTTRHATSSSASKSSGSAVSSTRVRKVTGQAFDVGYGTVQVRITVRGHKILDVTALSLPSGGHSSDISSFAGPQLRQEALTAQSAHIDAVSGATYTSSGYAQSLQSALDTAFKA